MGRTQSEQPRRDRCGQCRPPRKMGSCSTPCPNKTNLGVEQALTVAIMLAVDVFSTPEASVGDGGGLLSRHGGLKCLLCGLCGRGGRRSEVLDEGLRRLCEERKESAHEREMDDSGKSKNDGKEDATQIGLV